MRFSIYALLLGLIVSAQSAHATLIVTWEGACDASCRSAKAVLRISDENPKGDAKFHRGQRKFFEGFAFEVTQNNGDVVAFDFDRATGYRRILGYPSASFQGADGSTFDAGGPVYALAWTADTPFGRFSGPDSEFCSRDGVCRVPEGGTLGIAAAALAGLVYLRRRKASFLGA